MLVELHLEYGHLQSIDRVEQGELEANHWLYSSGGSIDAAGSLNIWEFNEL